MSCGDLEACKYTEIFRNKLQSRVSKGWESQWIRVLCKS